MINWVFYGWYFSFLSLTHKSEFLARPIRFVWALTGYIWAKIDENIRSDFEKKPYFFSFSYGICPLILSCWINARDIFKRWTYGLYERWQATRGTCQNWRICKLDILKPTMYLTSNQKDHKLEELILKIFIVTIIVLLIIIIIITIISNKMFRPRKLYETLKSETCKLLSEI